MKGQNHACPHVNATRQIFMNLLGAALVLRPLSLPVDTSARFPASTNSYDGAKPRATLVLSGKTLYGTTSDHAGAYGGACGTVFKVDTNGRDFDVLHFFTPVSYPTPTNSDGAFPYAGLVLSGHTLYGTARDGGIGGSGTIFKVNTDGTGFITLHAFSPLGGRDLTNWDGAFPEAELTVSGNTLYGTTWSGGTGRWGTVFRLNTDGEGFTVLHSFTAGLCNKNGHTSNTDGACPESGVILSGCVLYGTAHAGGEAGNGTVFRLNTDGSGFAVLHSFSTHGLSAPNNTNNDGENPKGLVLSGHTLYEIASECGRAYWGTLFRVNTDGTGFEVLHSFDSSGGAGPRASPVLSGDKLYGTANFGGGEGGGTVFKVRTNGTGFAVLHRFTAEPLPPGLTD